MAESLIGVAPDFARFVEDWNRLELRATPPLHRRICAWLEQAWRRRRRRLLLLVFRNAGKSSLVGLFCAWLLLANPCLRILVLAADMDLARKMVRNVRGIIERHPATGTLKPRRPAQWASDQFTVERASELRDPSVLARGIGTNITGSRADVIVCDDVEVPNTADTGHKRADLRERLSELDYVLVPDGTQLYIGTPHTYYSIYAEAARPESGESEPYLAGFQRLTIPLLDAAGASAWPERFPPETIAAIRRRSGEAKFASQMMLEPRDIVEARLDPARLRRYEGELVYLESNGLASLSLDGRRLVSASCWWDPAYGAPGSGDRSAIAAVFSDAEGGYWLHRIAYLSHDAQRLGELDEASQLCRQAVRFAAALYLPAIAVETNGIGRFLPGLLRREIARAGFAIAVREQHTSRAKAQRILEAFDVVLAAGALNAHASVFQTPFIQEMREWRPGAHRPDDGLDAVAGCLLSEPVRLSRLAARPGRPGAPARPDWRADWRPGDAPFQINSRFDP